VSLATSFEASRATLTDDAGGGRDWFRERAAAHGMTTVCEADGTLCAWRGVPTVDLPGLVVGGTLAEPLGLVAAFTALEAAVSPVGRRPVGIVAGTGSTIRPDRYAAFLELRTEPGRQLTAGPATASGSWASTTWEVTISAHRGAANRAGQPLNARTDPMLTAAMTVLAADKRARLAQGLASVTAVSTGPAVPGRLVGEVAIRMDLRAPDAATLDGLGTEVRRQLEQRAGRDGTVVVVAELTHVPAQTFDDGLGARFGVPPSGLATADADLAAAVAAAGVPVAVLLIPRHREQALHAAGWHAATAALATALRS
jgi:hypothetical protein